MPADMIMIYTVSLRIYNNGKNNQMRGWWIGV